MKKDNLIKGAAVLGVLTLMAGGVVAADAATNNSAVKNLNKTENRGRGLGLNGQMAGLTAEQKTAKLAEMEANRTAHQAQMTEKRTAVDAAIKAGDYNAWVLAVGADSPQAQKITAANFAKFSEAHNLMEQARTIFTDLGLENQGRGMGMGMGAGMGQMMNK